VRLAIALAAILLVVAAAPAAAQPTAGDADLVVTVAFDKPEYGGADEVRATVTVTNTGTAPARDVTLTAEGNSPFQPQDWGELDPFGDGVDLAPGERIRLEPVRRIVDAVAVMTLAVTATSPDPERDPGNNRAVAEAPVSVRYVDVTGLLYGDRDGDNQVDPGEPMSGVGVEINGGVPSLVLTGRTDATGRFAFPGVPEGFYTLIPGLPAGWQVDGTHALDVRTGGGDFVVRVVRAVTSLSGAITFDRAAYAVGDTVHERVTLTNHGATDLAGVTARCVEGAGPNTLSGLEWGDLTHDVGAGVTVRAGETRTFDFAAVVPEGGRLYGFVTITCWFSTAFKYDDGPSVTARADVPGGRGASGGDVFVDRDQDMHVDAGEPVPGVKLFLVGDDGAVVARTVTGATGHFLFTDVPANSYDLRLAGPWRLAYEASLRVGVYADDVVESAMVRVVPGPFQPDLDAPPVRPDTPSTSDLPATPSAQASPRPANLADTGVSVVELSVLGMLLSLTGTALLFVRRREVS